MRHRESLRGKAGGFDAAVERCSFQLSGTTLVHLEIGLARSRRRLAPGTDGSGRRVVGAAALSMRARAITGFYIAKRSPCTGHLRPERGGAWR